MFGPAGELALRPPAPTRTRGLPTQTAIVATADRCPGGLRVGETVHEVSSRVPLLWLEKARGSAASPQRRSLCGQLAKLDPGDDYHYQPDEDKIQRRPEVGLSQDRPRGSYVRRQREPEFSPRRRLSACRDAKKNFARQNDPISTAISEGWSWKNPTLIRRFGALIPIKWTNKSRPIMIPYSARVYFCKIR